MLVYTARSALGYSQGPCTSANKGPLIFAVGDSDQMIYFLQVHAEGWGGSWCNAPTPTLNPHPHNTPPPTPTPYHSTNRYFFWGHMVCRIRVYKMLTEKSWNAFPSWAVFKMAAVNECRKVEKRDFHISNSNSQIFHLNVYFWEWQIRTHH